MASAKKPRRITTKSDQDHLNNEQSTLSTILPHDIMLDILSRLPIKSLSQLRSISKSYNTLHTDHVFLTLHMNNYPQPQHHLLKEKLIFRGQNNLYTLAYQDPTNNNMVEIKFPVLNVGISRIRIRGSCNGILLVRILMSNLLYLWNVTSGEYIEVVDNCFNESRGAYSVYGFGYSHILDDYEIVRVTSQNDTLFRSQVAVYSLRRGSWRRIVDSIAYKFQGDKSGEFVNGCLHWVAFDNKKQYKCALLVAFVVGGRKFREIPMPYCDVGDGYETTVTSFRKRLCLIHCSSLCVSKFEFWVMQEYGVRESWTRLFRIQINTTSKYISDSVLCFMENGSVLMKVDGKNMYFCDPEKGNRRLTMLDDRRIVEASTYLESNVSFKDLLNCCDLVSGVGSEKRLETLDECNYDFDECDLVSDAGDEEIEEGGIIEDSGEIDFPSDSVIEPETIFISSCDDEKLLNIGRQLGINVENGEMAQSIHKLLKEKRTGWIARFTTLLREEEKKEQRYGDGSSVSEAC